MAAAGVVTAAAGGRDQELVLFYAASVFVSFLAGLIAMSRFSWQERRTGFLVVNLVGAAAVAFTLAVNLTRGDPIISIAAALLIAVGLYALWVRSGRPRGIRNVAAEAEQEEDTTIH
jgi:4-amino-4-deoxy-L-arabinose transferase-like glycosyltransferase